MTADKNNLDEIIKKSPPLKKVGAPSGNQNARKNIAVDGKMKKRQPQKHSGGNSREYWIGRLKRDAPDHLELLEKGNYKSVAEAVRNAGLKKAPPPKIEQMFNTIEKLELQELERLLYLAECRIKALEKKTTLHKISRILHKKFSKENENVVIILFCSMDLYRIDISQGDKQFNYEKKYDAELIVSNTYDFNGAYNGPRPNEINNCLQLFTDYTEGLVYKETYEEFVNQFSLPRVHRLIFIIYNGSKNQFLHPQYTHIKQSTDREEYPNIKGLYFDAIQAFLDKI